MPFKIEAYFLPIPAPPPDPSRPAVTMGIPVAGPIAMGIPVSIVEGTPVMRNGQPVVMAPGINPGVSSVSRMDPATGRLQRFARLAGPGTTVALNSPRPMTPEPRPYINPNPPTLPSAYDRTTPAERARGRAFVERAEAHASRARLAALRGEPASPSTASEASISPPESPRTPDSEEETYLFASRPDDR